MQISSKGVALVKQYEGLRLKRYIDAAGYPTIGWGHKLAGGELYGVISVETAQRLLDNDLAKVSREVNDMVKAPINQSMFDALVSFAFNLGDDALRGSTLLRLINSRDYAAAKLQFVRWNKARVNGKLVVLEGLTKRRQAEANLFGAQGYFPKLLGDALE